MKGSYVLIIWLKHDQEIEVGKLGRIFFKKGYYAYIGSALNGIEKRVERHLRKEKKIRWHIDYLLQYGEIVNVFIKESVKKEECEIAKKFTPYFLCIEKFGCSDCKCKSHLFYAEKYEDFLSIIKNSLKRFK